jgi:hypothetical protein
MKIEEFKATTVAADHEIHVNYLTTGEIIK